MALFQKHNCKRCGREAKMLTRTKLADNNYLCYECTKDLENVFVYNFLPKLTYTDFIDYLDRKEENKTKVAQFKVSKVFFDKVFVDEEHGWVVFNHDNRMPFEEDLVKINPYVFELKDLVFSIIYENIKKVKEKTLSANITSDYYLIMAFKDKFYPYAFKDVIEKNHKSKIVDKGIFRKNLEYISNVDAIVDLETFFEVFLFNNGVSTPNFIEKGLPTEDDFEKNKVFFTRLFNLYKNEYITIEDFDNILLSICNADEKKKEYIKKIYNKNFKNK